MIVRGAHVLVLTGLLALAGQACGGDDSDESGTPAPTSAPATPTAGATQTAASPTPATGASPTPASQFGGSVSPVSAPATSGEVVTVKNVRVGTGVQFDTIVFEFTGKTLPGYTVQFVDKVPPCPSDVPPPPTPVPPTPTVPRGRGTPTEAPEPTDTPAPTATPFGVVAGKAIISVLLSPAANGDTVARTDFRGGSGALVQATQVCDGGGVIAWVIGSKEKTSFRVTAHQDPARLVIDIER